jgi:Protein of unknown function (DUF3106)
VTRRARHLLLVVALLGGAAVSQAQGLVGPSATAWSSLNGNQRGVLAPLERDWATISPAQQQKWVEVANRYGSMPPDERTRAQQRMTDWSRLPPSERARARLNFQEARQLSREERQQQWEAYRALPAAQRRDLAERAQAAPSRDAPAANTKSNVVRAPAAAVPHPVSPTVVQRGAGATTSLVTKPAKPPLHQQAGLPKVAATPEFVDSATLLPQRGAQGAAARPAADDGKGKGSKSQDK